VRIRNPFDSEHAVRLVAGLILAVIFLVAVSWPASALASFYRKLDAMSQDVQQQDFAAAKREIDDVAAFYDRLRAVGLQSIADSYLFANAFLHRAAYAYLVGEHDTVVRDLADRIDDPRASFLLASAKFRLVQQRYRGVVGTSAVAEQTVLIREVLDQINPDYERALRADLSNRFDFKWNYDLTSDPEAIRRALLPPAVPDLSDVEERKMKGAGTPSRRRKG
jgi:hypothetical protein